MNRKHLKPLLAILLILAGVFVWLRYADNQPSNTGNQPAENSSEEVADKADPKPTFTFAQATKSEQFVSSSPSHATVLPVVPAEVGIDFGVDVVVPSAMSITSAGKEYSSNTTIDEANRKNMRRTMDPNAPNGLYVVNYRSCVTESTCSLGSFQFAIERK